MRNTYPKERKKHPFKPYARKIHVYGNEWTYRITRRCIQVANPNCSQKWKIDLTDFTGMTWDQLERAEWKRYFPKIGPKDVKEYIENNLIGKKNEKFQIKK